MFLSNMVETCIEVYFSFQSVLKPFQLLDLLTSNLLQIKRSSFETIISCVVQRTSDYIVH